ncbi:MAG: histidine--tRNA ligase [candidate division WOR-3 bacterium]|nr:MAG: histidine--tRNA ligase [candidate division WOR-3 bacterium]
MKYQKPKGTRDLFGKELKRIESLCSSARDFFARYGYEEIRTPTFEHADLFIRSIGAHTDIVEKENYTFEIDKRTLMLRPEGTASTLRALIENRVPLPARLLYIGAMFRKEKPQKGRFREFIQVGTELIGEGAPFYDAEMIFQGKKFMDFLQARQIRVELNSIGCPECRADFKKTLRAYLEEFENAICADCKRRLDKNFLRIFDCKNARCQEIYDSAPKITDSLCEDCNAHYHQVKSFLKVFDVEFHENKKLVRGLDYYTRTVFEFKHGSLGSQDTILAGGRYDILMKELGGQDTPALGWAMGVDRLLIAMPDELPPIQDPKRFFIAVMGETYLNQGLELRNTILEHNFVCIIGNPCENIKKQFKDANRQKAEYVIVYGENEAEQGIYTVKNMTTGVQELIARDNFPAFLKGVK